jgi:hypothetical protein
MNGVPDRTGLHARARVVMRVVVAIAVAGFSCLAHSCAVQPSNLYRDHAALIGEAQAIVLAEAIVDKQALPNSCRFRVKRVLKGQVADQVVVPCRPQLFGEMAADPRSHNDSSFWQSHMGRVTYGTTCQIVKPAFVAGHHYLLLLGIEPDTKQFEEIRRADDKWLLFVEQYLQRLNAQGMPQDPAAR